MIIGEVYVTTHSKEYRSIHRYHTQKLLMHPEQRAFCDRVKNLFPDKFTNQDVLEIGSQNINGSIRELFTGGNYLGIDLGCGKDVDLVCHGRDYYRDTP